MPHTASIDPVVAENLRAVMREKGRTAYSVAKAIGVSPNWIYRIINMDRGIQIPTLRKVAEELEVSIGELLETSTPAVARSGNHAVPTVHEGGVILGERLAASRKRTGLAQVELAVAMGDRYDQTMISHVESSRSGLVSEGLAKAALALHVSTDYLLGLTDDPTPADQRNVGNGNHPYSIDETRAIADAGRDGAEDTVIRPVEVLEVMAAAGSGAHVYDETPVGVLWFQDDWLRRQSIDPAQCHVITVRGDSMEPTLPDGCSILVDPNRRELRDKHIYVLRTEDGVVAKRLRFKNGWHLTSDNPEWAPAMLSEDMEVKGEVRWLGRTF